MSAACLFFCSVALRYVSTCFKYRVDTLYNIILRFCSAVCFNLCIHFFVNCSFSNCNYGKQFKIIHNVLYLSVVLCCSDNSFQIAFPFLLDIIITYHDIFYNIFYIFFYLFFSFFSHVKHTPPPILPRQHSPAYARTF